MQSCPDKSVNWLVTLFMYIGEMVFMSYFIVICIFQNSRNHCESANTMCKCKILKRKKDRTFTK